MEIKQNILDAVNEWLTPTFDNEIPATLSVSCENIPNAATVTATDNCGTATVTMTEATTPGSCPSA